MAWSRVEKSGTATGFTTVVDVLEILGTNLNGWLNLEFDNTGANALTDCTVQVKDHSSGEYYDYITGAEWAEDTNNVLHLSASPETLADGTKAHATIALFGFYAVKVTATAGTATTLTVRAGLSQRE